MALVFSANSWNSDVANPEEHSVLLEDNGYYWFLYRYFVIANFDNQFQLMDLYGKNEIDGYQLFRLEAELKLALEDVSHKSEQWHVLTGWTNNVSRDNEIWQEIEKDKMIVLIQQLLWLIDFAQKHNLKLICFGD